MIDFSKVLHNEFGYDWEKELFSALTPYPYLADILVILGAFTVGAALAVMLFFLLRCFLLRFYRRCCNMSPELQRCISKIAFSLVGCLPVVMTNYCVWCNGIHEWIAVLTQKLMSGVLIFCLTSALVCGIRTFGFWYKQQRNAEQRPIEGLLSISIIFVWTGALIVYVSLLVNKSPLYFLSGLGAIAAVLLLFFQQTILSLVASVQVNVDHLVEIGDWIAMESGNVDGVVKEITLHTLKVRNWDRTLVCMPICNLVNNPFVNYTAMQKSGGRRIKRAFLIDQRSIRFLSMEEIEMLRGFDLLKDYLDSKKDEIVRYNSGRSQFNTRYLTNLGTFRMYAQLYLENNPHIRRDMPLLVRELSPASTGVPLEIYCFSKEVTLRPYEQVQSDIMEHFLAILPNFRLRVFQECSDIYQEIGTQVDIVGGAFRFDQLKNPVYPEQDSAVQHTCMQTMPSAERTCQVQ